MVGYQQDESLTPHQKLIAGCVSGCVTRFLTQPLDVIKMKTQLLKTEKPLTYPQLIVRIFRRKGLKSFWDGHNIGQLYSILSVSTQFYVYELSTKFAHGYFANRYEVATAFVCGCVSGCASAAIVSPLDVIRVRQIVGKKQYGGFINSFHMVYKSGGIPAFYEGLGAALLMMGPSVGISFATFNVTQMFLLRQLVTPRCEDGKCRSPGTDASAQQLALASTVAGAITGFVSKTLTYPFDLVKRRLQMATHVSQTASTKANDLVKCRKIVECFTKALKKDGFLGLYRGYNVTVIKAQLTTVIAFTSYELTCFIFRELK